MNLLAKTLSRAIYCVMYGEKYLMEYIEYVVYMLIKEMTPGMASPMVKLFYLRLLPLGNRTRGDVGLV